LAIYGENGGGARDNISICVRAIAPTDTTATMTSVYDGNGGEQVAEELRHKYNLKVECEVFKKALEKNRNNLDPSDYQLQLNYLNDCLAMIDNFNTETYLDRRRQYYVDYINLHPEQQQAIVQEYNEILQDEVELRFLTPEIAEKEKAKFALGIDQELQQQTAESSDLQSKRPSRIGWSIFFTTLSAFLFFATLIPALHIATGAWGMFDFFYQVANLTGGLPLIQLTLTALSLIPTVAFIGHAHRGKLTSQEEVNVEAANELAHNLLKDRSAFAPVPIVSSSMSVNTDEHTPVSFSALTDSSSMSLTS